LFLLRPRDGGQRGIRRGTTGPSKRRLRVLRATTMATPPAVPASTTNGPALPAAPSCSSPVGSHTRSGTRATYVPEPWTSVSRASRGDDARNRRILRRASAGPGL